MLHDFLDLEPHSLDPSQHLPPPLPQPLPSPTEAEVELPHLSRSRSRDPQRGNSGSGNALSESYTMPPPSTGKRALSPATTAAAMFRPCASPPLAPACWQPYDYQTASHSAELCSAIGSEPPQLPSRQIQSCSGNDVALPARSPGLLSARRSLSMSEKSRSSVLARPASRGAGATSSGEIKSSGSGDHHSGSPGMTNGQFGLRMVVSGEVQLEAHGSMAVNQEAQPQGSGGSGHKHEIDLDDPLMARFLLLEDNQAGRWIDQVAPSRALGVQPAEVGR